jgi:hypothetical protein
MSLSKMGGGGREARRSSQLLGMEKRVEEVEVEGECHGPAKHEIEHGGPLGVSHPAGVKAHQGEEAKAERKVEEVEHGDVSADVPGGN